MSGRIVTVCLLRVTHDWLIFEFDHLTSLNPPQHHVLVLVYNLSDPVENFTRLRRVMGLSMSDWSGPRRVCNSYDTLKESTKRLSIGLRSWHLDFLLSTLDFTDMFEVPDLTTHRKRGNSPFTLPSFIKKIFRIN